MGITTTITAAEREARVRAAAEAEHSGEMEGLSITPDVRRDSAAYTEGEISSDELVRRTRARYVLV